MTALDARIPPRIKALIERYGVAATLRTYARTSNNSAGTVSTTPTDTLVTAIAPVPVTKNLVNGDTVLSTDSWTVIAAYQLAVTPAVGSRITFGSRIYAVTAVVETWTGEQNAAYECVLRASA